jgi:flagellar motor switch protein FliM
MALSQEEIDALLTQLNDSADEDPFALKKVRDFDFRFAKRLEKFNPNQLQTIRGIHDTFSRLLNNTMSVYMKNRVEATVKRIEQITYGDFIAANDSEALYVIYSMDPLPGSGMIKIDLGLMYAVIDRLLGGPGWIPEKLRELTEIERALVTKFLSRIFASYREAWNYLATISFKIEAMDSNPQLIPRIIPLDQMVAVVTTELQIGDTVGSMTFCLPYAVLSKIGPQLAEFQWSPNVHTGREVTEEDIHKLAMNLGHADVDIDVDLGRTVVSLRELVAMKVGDVLVFDNETSEPLSVHVNGCEKFHVYPGVHRDRLAVQIADVVEEQS